jgi:beta-lactamase regulating signal transducer with metallopeptidase domain
MTTFAQLALTQIWQVAAVTLAVAVVVRICCRRRPHLAYLLWLVVIAKSLTPPVWSSPAGIFSWVATPRATANRTQLAATVSAHDPPSVDRMPPGAATTRPQTLAAGSESMERSQTPYFPTAASAVALVWLGGTLMLAAVFFGNGIRIVRRLKRTALPLEPAWLEQLDACARQLGLRRKVRLLVTSEPLGPAVYGVVRPVVVLPDAVAGSAARGALPSILLHELIHVRRGDAFIALLQVMTQCVWWFHPCVWWANREANREREQACDEELLASTPLDPADYAQCLLDVLRTKQTLRPIAGFPGVRAVEVTKRRLEHIMQPRTRFHRRTPMWCWGIALVLALIALPGAGVAFNSRSEASGVAQANDPGPPTVATEIVVSQNFFVIPIRTKLQQMLVANGKPVHAMIETNAYALLGKRGDDLLKALDAPALKRALAAIKSRDHDASIVFVSGHLGEATPEMFKAGQNDFDALDALYRSLAKEAHLRVASVYDTSDGSSDRWQKTIAFLKGIDLAKETAAETGAGDRDVTAYPVQNKISQLLTAGFNNFRFPVADCVLYVHKPLDANDHPMIGLQLETQLKQVVSQLNLPRRGRIDYHLIPADPNRQAFLRNNDAMMKQFYPNEAPLLTKELGFQNYSTTF